MSVQEYKRLLFNSILDLLWRQWCALGVPGNIATGMDSETVLDPEALILFSAEFARYDQRLYDLILDWMDVHSSQINIQRLKALYTKAECKDELSLGYIAAVASESDYGRWNKPAKDFCPKDKTTTVALFKDLNCEPDTFIPTHDPIALQYGLDRNLRQKSGKIPSIIPENTASLLFRMRSIMGIAARAETILVMLTTPSCKVQDIVDKSGYTWKSIQDVLKELTAGSFVSSINGTKRGKQYNLTRPEKIRQLFGLSKILYPNWLDVYDSISILWRTVSNPNMVKVSDETFKNELRTLYDSKLHSRFISSGHHGLMKISQDLANYPKVIQEIIH